MDAVTAPLVAVGDEITVPEADYCYGVGGLHMIVTHVAERALQLPGLEWVQLRGIDIRPDGREGHPRYALVRIVALRRPGAVRRTAQAASG